MTRYLTGIFVLALCSSCTVYQTNILQSNIQGKDREPFTFENDSIRISYAFPKGQANLQVFNKSATRPLYLDWSKSALIVGANSNFFWTSDMVEADRVLFLPPQTVHTTIPFNLPQDVTLPNGKPSDELYTSETSPMKFRTYLFLSQDENFSDPIMLDHSFWLSERHQTRQPVYTRRGQNVYYAEIMTEGGQAAATVFGIVAAIPVAWLLIQVDDVE